MITMRDDTWLQTSDESSTRALVLPNAPRRRERTRMRMRMRTGANHSPRTVRALKWTVVTVALFVALVPILYTVSVSFKSPDDILSTRLLPSRLAGSNWITAFTEFPVLTYLKNSMLMALIAVVLCLIIAIPANYAIARLRVGGDRALALIVSAYVAPPVVAIIPFFMMVRAVGLLDSVIGLGLVQGLLLTPVAVWLLDGFFRSIPHDLDEAAQLDGCGPVRTLWAVILPLVMPGVVAVAIIVFILVYNDFLISLMLTQSTTSQTLPVGISLMQGRRESLFGPMAAASLAGVIPLYVLALFLQKWLVGGLTQGSIK